MISFSEPSTTKQEFRTLLKKPQVKGYTMAILTIVTLSFFTIFALRPALKSFFQIRKQIEDAREVDKKLEDKINKLLQAQELYTKRSNDLALIEQALPSEPQYSEFLQKFETIVNDNEATTTAFETTDELPLFGVQNITPSPFLLSKPGMVSNSEPTIPSANFKATIVAKYPQLTNILNSLLNIRRLVTIDSIHLKVKENNNADTITRSVEQSLNAGAQYYFETEKNE